MLPSILILDVTESQISTEKYQGSFRIRSCTGFQGILLNLEIWLSQPTLGVSFLAASVNSVCCCKHLNSKGMDVYRLVRARLPGETRFPTVRKEHAWMKQREENITEKMYAALPDL